MENMIIVFTLLGSVLIFLLGILLVAGRPILKVHARLSKRQQIFFGMFMIAWGIFLAFGIGGIHDYFNLTSNQEAAVFGVLLVIAFIPLLLFAIVRFVENARQ